MKRGGQHGYITAEFALVLPAVVMVLTVALALIQVGVLRLTAVEAARAGAREAALGSGTAQVVAVAREVAGQGAQVEVASGAGIRAGDSTGALVSVTVGIPLRGVLGGIGLVLGDDALGGGAEGGSYVSHTAVARVEPGA